MRKCCTLYTQAPPAASASHASHSESSEDCDATSVTVTADVPDATVVTTKGNTVILFSTTTVTPTGAPTSYYDDGMWHTRYAIKPAASPEAEKPSANDEGAAPKFDKSTHRQALNGTHHDRREAETLDATPTAPSTANGSGAVGSGAPLMFAQPLLPRATGIAARAVLPTGDVVARALPTGGVAARALPTGGIAARAVPSGEVVARAVPSGNIAARAVPSGGVVARAVPTGSVGESSEVLSADELPVIANLARRAPAYSVVSWNETMQG